MDGYVIMTTPVHRYVSLWDFDGSGTQELSFKAGDRFQAVDRSGDWWLVDRINALGGKTGEQGYVPFNYMAEEGTMEEQRWFFRELSRTEANNLLMKGGNAAGSFLVRQSDKQDFDYALSVRATDGVKHFKILRNSQGEYHLNSSSLFPDLDKLIEYYHDRPVIKGVTLTKPCVKDEPMATDLNPLPLDEWERPKEEFILGKKLGSGNFGQVHEGYWKGRVKMRVAIKTIKQDVTNREIFRKETAFLKTLRHRNLLSLYAVCSVGDPFYIVTELLSKGDLLHFLRGPEGEKLSVEGLLDIAGQVIDGMHYLEANNCIHRDLAARNVLIGLNNICRLADFGLARIITDDCYMSYSKDVPYKWTAPEALEYGRFTIKSDVWSFGVLLHEIMSRGVIPYPGISNAELLLYLKQGKRMSAPENCSRKIYEVMLDCWNANAQKRPSFNELKISMDSLAFYEPSEESPKPVKLKGIIARLKKNAN
ncbi:PREDICTED: protein-tyrosine kinase 6 [Nanorana parkeri]|uniref:protein-tyrosine kinase 6 n=1 Tax=Nanorana parkeri TaxID=125878 RepID=UPI000854AA3D|nr:PREDICTED: protein-tyrosine kinase 6 [Nanorana parkeri]